jgi:predicted MFS family arabinose efflux permease
MVMFTILPVAFFLLREEEIAIDSNAQLRTTGQQLARMSREKAMWLAVGLMTLFYLAPGLQTAVFYKQQDELHLNTRWQGIFELIGGACGMAAAFGYAFLCKRVNLRKLLLVSLAFGTLANLPYMAYTSVPRAVVIEGFNGFAYGLAELAIMDLAVRATPKGIEGFGFSLMMSVRNFALFGSDWLGSNLIDHFHWRFRSVVLTNSLVCALTIPAVLLLPSMMLKRKDAEPEVQTQIKPAVRDQEQCEVEEVGV